jgi:transcriptional regulator with XRE-family HTH domain
MKSDRINKIGDRLRVRRVEKKLSQENLASEIGISTTAYSRIERGLTNVSIDRLDQIATCLEVSLEWLMGSSKDFYRTVNNTDMVRESEYVYPFDNKQALLMQIERQQIEKDFLNKTIAEKDKVIALLNDVISGTAKKSKQKTPIRKYR